MTLIPTLITERLTLRALRYPDFPAYAAFLASGRAIHMGGPHDQRTAWSWFCNDTAQWVLLDMGALMIERRADGMVVGQTAVIHGPFFPEPELGWFLYDGFEGNGYATEAAEALLAWAFDERCLPTLVSYVDPHNHKSAAVARRLGGRIDPAAATPNNDPDNVWRYGRAA